MTVQTESQSQTTDAGEVDQTQGIESTLDQGTESTETESTDSPETTETETEESTTAEGEDETGETEAEAEGRDSEGNDATDETWLPDEQAKQFPLEVLADYAKRRGYKWTNEQIAQSADLQKLLKDKLNTDIYVKSLEQDSTATDLDENQFDETEQAEETAQTETTAGTESDPVKAHYARVDQIVSELDQKVVADFGKGLLEDMGVQTDVVKLQQMLANPKLTPEQRAEVQGALGLAQNAPKIGARLARVGVDLITSTLSKVIDDAIEARYPGTRQNYERTLYRNAAATAWETLRQSTAQGGAKPYANLPNFGTAEFEKLVRGTENKLGIGKDGLADMVFKGVDPRDSKAMQAAARRAYVMVARTANGQSVTPAAVKQAVETGRRQATESAQRRQAGRAMGSGLTSKALNNQPEDDDILAALKDQISRTNETWDLPSKKKS